LRACGFVVGNFVCVLVVCGFVSWGLVFCGKDVCGLGGCGFTCVVCGFTCVADGCVREITVGLGDFDVVGGCLAEGVRERGLDLVVIEGGGGELSCGS
jgi:hypothetical protein